MTPQPPLGGDFSPLEVSISGGGEVAPENCPATAKIRYAYTATPIYPGDYVFGVESGRSGFVRVTEATTLPPFSIYAQFDSTDDFIPLKGGDTAIEEVRSERLEVRSNVFDLSGKHITPHKGGDGGSLPNGINIIDGRKVFVK